MTSQERREMFAAIAKQILRSMTPNMGTRYSGQQISYAKGRAWQQMRKAGY